MSAFASASIAASLVLLIPGVLSGQAKTSDQLAKGATVYMVASQFGVEWATFERYGHTSPEVLERTPRLRFRYRVPTAEACRIGAAAAVVAWGTSHSDRTVRAEIECTNHKIDLKLEPKEPVRLLQRRRSDGEIVYTYGI